MTFILHLSRVLGVLLGVALGLVIAYFACAWVGIPIGVILGASIGCLFGFLPPECARHGIKLALRRAGTARLKERLHGEHGLAVIIIDELVARGEPVEQFRDHVEALVRSPSAFQRRCGKQCRRKWFPAMNP